MSAAGLSKPRLERMHRVLSGYVEREEILVEDCKLRLDGMIGILFTQRMMESPEPPKVFRDFWTLAYGAMG